MIKKKIKIVDVGSDRNFIKTILQNCKNSLINYTVIDPLPIFLEKFKEENRNIKKLRLNVLKYCVAKNNSKKTFFINSDSTTSSYFKSNHKILDLIRDDKKFDEQKKINLKTFSLNKIFKKHKINKIDLLTLCTQGSELDIIKGTQKYLKNISLIRVHGDWVFKYLNEPLIGETIGHLDRKGFSLLNISPAVMWFDKCITSDIFFINKRIIQPKTTIEKKIFENTIQILLAFGKITDVLILLKINNFSLDFVKKQFANSNIFYKILIDYYPYTKVIAIASNLIIRFLKLLRLSFWRPNFLPLFKFLKLYYSNDSRS